MFRASGHIRAETQQALLQALKSSCLCCWALGQLFGGDSWGGLGAAGLRRPGWRGTPCLGWRAPCLEPQPRQEPSVLDRTLWSFPEGKRAKMKCWPAGFPWDRDLGRVTVSLEPSVPR